MIQVLQSLPRAATKVAGFASRVFTAVFRPGKGASLNSLHTEVLNLEKRLDNYEEANQARFAEISVRLDAHDEKFRELPTMPQLFMVMDQLLEKSLNHVDERLAEHARSIDGLKASVQHTDELLERVLERVEGVRTVA